MINYIIVGGLVLATLILTALLPFCDSENLNFRACFFVGYSFKPCGIFNF